MTRNHADTSRQETFFKLFRQENNYDNTCGFGLISADIVQSIRRISSVQERKRGEAGVNCEEDKLGGQLIAS